MAIQQFARLSISLFTEQNNWNHLLKEGVEPFLSLKKHIGWIKYYRISLNYQRGPNIRLTLYISKGSCFSLSQAVNEFFTNHFNNPLVYTNREDICFPIAAFKDFPANTINYGLYNDLALFKYSSFYFIETPLKYYQVLSDIILAEVSNELSQEDNLITLAVFLHLIIYRELLQTRKSDIIHTYSCEIEKGSSQRLLKKIDERHFEIVSMLSDALNKKNETIWQSHFSRILSKTVNKIMKDNGFKQDLEKTTPDVMLYIHKLLTSVISYQLGLNVHLKQQVHLYLFYILKQPDFIMC